MRFCKLPSPERFISSRAEILMVANKIMKDLVLYRVCEHVEFLMMECIA
jgi:hypothetical protein